MLYELIWRNSTTAINASYQF